MKPAVKKNEYFGEMLVRKGHVFFKKRNILLNRCTFQFELGDSADKYKRSLTPYMSDHICITNSNKEGGFQIKCEI